MKFVLITALTLLFGCLVGLVFSRSPGGYSQLTTFDKAWTIFRATHGKHYETKEEEMFRKQIFAENLKQIESHNFLYEKGLKSYSLGINQFSDMEMDEVSKLLNGFRGQKGGTLRQKGVAYLPLLSKTELPMEIDWRNRGYVTPVKDQGMCGSCWAFSATGSLEGQHFRKTGKLVSLSEQNLIDCSREEGNEGCSGGYMDYAFKYIQVNDGIDTEESYPYEANDGKCRYRKSHRGATDCGFVDLDSGNETMLKEVVATAGPVSVAIDASNQSFLQYSGGIYNEPDCSDTILDHGVLVVGYGTENGHDYWLIKNSWGESWGENGYGRMTRNKHNQCGIATMASYPLV